MVPCSVRQIVETGRGRQAELLLAAARGRRALQAAAAIPDVAGAERSIGLWTTLERPRLPGGRLAAILGALGYLHDSRA